MKEYLIFDIGDRTLGLNVSDVQQVVRAATLSESADASGEIEGLLKYGDDTAGGIMQTEIVKVSSDQSVSQAIGWRA